MLHTDNYVSGFRTPENKNNVETLEKKLAEILSRMVHASPAYWMKQCRKSKTFKIVPTFTLRSETRDADGRLIYAAFTKINSLDNLAFYRKYFFIDQRKISQTKWLENELKKHNENPSNKDIAPIVILVGGSRHKLPLEDVKFYFDCKGKWASKYKINYLPATVEQKRGEDYLLVNEIYIGL